MSKIENFTLFTTVTHKARWPNFYSLTADHNDTYYRLTDGQKLIFDCISMSHKLFLLFYQNMFYKNIEAEYFKNKSQPEILKILVAGLEIRHNYMS